MPEWAPLAKVAAARRHGAEVVLHGENFDEAYVRAREIEAARSLVFVHPFDDPA
jgi:threonine dehydratase